MIGHRIYSTSPAGSFCEYHTQPFEHAASTGQGIQGNSWMPQQNHFSSFSGEGNLKMKGGGSFAPQEGQPSPAKRHGRAILTERDAQDIFMYKPASSAKERYNAGVLARFYGVSIKTVRDIWVGRTWYRSTFHLDPSKPILSARLDKKPGRPRGAKDSKPRTRTLYKVDSTPTSDETTLPLHVAVACHRPTFYTCLASAAQPPTDAIASTIEGAQELRGAEPYCSITRHEYAPHFSCSESTPPQSPDGSDDAPCAASWLSCSSSDFADPFHDDWAFWPKEEPAALVVSL
uniref:Uncharacterized protein n=1 Tax=Cryptomonas curvata TaxID=233186 RepID=A0A7S0LV42_9CRYP|mmetsp:Transcript_10519/g.22493  ORF Transcript_10519/g.22493 Transcript_10519/m.22493 type:complete len:289 (+) Transcript_10519:156-1022(+)